jgi:acetyl esterase/lipase
VLRTHLRSPANARTHAYHPRAIEVRPRRPPRAGTAARTRPGGERWWLAFLVFLAAVGVSAWILPGSGDGTTPSAVGDGKPLTVSYGSLPQQKLDVYLPASGTGPFPVLVYAHSGGWIGGSRRQVPDVIRALIPDVHVAVVSIDYRLIRTGPTGRYTNTFPTASYDMDQAIRFVRANATRLHLDPNRIIAAGASAGGQIAAMAGAAPGVYRDPNLPPSLVGVSPVVQGVIDYVGPTDFRTLARGGSWAPALTAGLLDCVPLHPETCNQKLETEASVASHLTAAAPPAYLAYGEQDNLSVPKTQGAPLAFAWMLARGDQHQADPSFRAVQYEQQPRVGHNFSVRNSNHGALEGWLNSVLGQ